MTYPPQQPQGDWGGQQPYDPSQQGYGQQQPPGSGEQLPSYDLEPAADPYATQSNPYSAPPNPYPAPQPGYDPTQYSAPPVSAAPASGQPFGGQPMMPAPAPSSGPPVWIFIVGGLVLLALIGVGVVFAFSSTGGDPDDDPTDSAQSATQSASDDPPSPTPDGDMIYDSNTGLGFEAISSWQTLQSGVDIPGFSSFEGQQLEVAANWVALMGVGEIDATEYGYKDSGDLKDTVKAVAKDYDENNFGEDPKGLDRDVDPEYNDSDLAGKPAITMAYHLTWDEGENPDTGEQIVLALVDVGGGRVAGFLGSLPDSTPNSEVDNAVTAAGTLAFS